MMYYFIVNVVSPFQQKYGSYLETSKAGVEIKYSHALVNHYVLALELKNKLRQSWRHKTQSTSKNGPIAAS